MKKFKITVNGKAYEVTAELVSDSSAPAPATTVALEAGARSPPAAGETGRHRRRRGHPLPRRDGAPAAADQAATAAAVATANSRFAFTYNACAAFALAVRVRRV